MKFARVRFRLASLLFFASLVKLKGRAVGFLNARLLALFLRRGERKAFSFEDRFGGSGMVVERLLPVLLPAATFEIGFERGFQFFPETGVEVFSMLAVPVKHVHRARLRCSGSIHIHWLGSTEATGN